MKKIINLELVYLFSLGALSSLSLPPFNLFFINFISFSLFFYFLIKKKKFKDTTFFIYGWVFGFGFFLTNLYWITISLTFDQSLKFLIPFSFILIPSFLSVFYGLAIYIFSIFKSKDIISSFFLFSLLFGIVEFIKGNVLSGFPWNLIAFSFSNNVEILSIISIIGTYGFNLICISLFSSPAIFFLRQNKKHLIVLATFILMPILAYIYGDNYKKNFLESEKKLNDFTIRIIASNVSLEKFYKNVDPALIINDLIKISDPDLDKKTLFLWPEGIVPNISQADLINYKYLFDENFSNNHLIALGINKEYSQNGFKKIYNSFSVYDNEINLLHSYEKINLVPFGEFLPLESLLSKIGLKTITNNYQSYSKGEKREIIFLENDKFSLRILPLICYEIIYSGSLYKNDNFDYLVNISEDGWFGKSIGPKQHFVHSIFRAIESGKYLIRSTNNGMAAIINPIGIIENQVDFGKNGYIDFNEQRKIQSTIFSKYGNKVFGLIILLYIFLIFSFNRNHHE